MSAVSLPKRIREWGGRELAIVSVCFAIGLVVGILISLFEELLSTGTEPRHTVLPGGSGFVFQNSPYVVECGSRGPKPIRRGAPFRGPSLKCAAQAMEIHL